MGKQMMHYIGDCGDFESSQEIPQYRFHNAGEHVEHVKGGTSNLELAWCSVTGMSRRE